MMHHVKSIILLLMTISNAQSQIITNWASNAPSNKLPAARGNQIIGYNAAQNTVWILGGYSKAVSGDYDNAVWDFNLQTESWTVHSSLSYNIHSSSQTYTQINNTIYFNSAGVIGTFDTDTMDDEFPSTVIPTMPRNTDSGCLTTDGRYLFLLGGADFNAYFQIFDTASNIWSNGPSMTPTGRYRIACQAINNYLYVIGGNSNADTLLDTVIKIDINDVSNIGAYSWTVLSQKLTNPTNYQVSVKFGDSVYLIGGTEAGPTQIKDVYVVNQINDDISAVLSMDKVRSGPAAIVANARIYVFGGFDYSPTDYVTDSWEVSNVILLPTDTPTNYPTSAPTNHPTRYPTTNVPTTLIPTTNHPTTNVPTTNYPTTMNPTTNIPTTMNPTTNIPTTMNPTTMKPTTRMPTTMNPSTDVPTTTNPTTNVATTNEPTTNGPTTAIPIASTSVPTTNSLTTTQSTISSTNEAMGNTQNRNQASTDTQSLLLMQILLITVVVLIFCFATLICVLLCFWRILKRKHNLNAKQTACAIACTSTGMVQSNTGEINCNVIDKTNSINSNMRMHSRDDSDAMDDMYDKVEITAMGKDTMGQNINGNFDRNDRLSASNSSSLYGVTANRTMGMSTMTNMNNQCIDRHQTNVHMTVEGVANKCSGAIP